MMLKNVPLKELQEEIARRGAASLPHPILATKPDFTELVEVCKQYMRFLDSGQYHEDNGFREYIYEAAMTTLYGEGVFAYINSLR
jgi:hypothetical protein